MTWLNLNLNDKLKVLENSSLYFYEGDNTIGMYYLGKKVQSKYFSGGDYRNLIEIPDFPLILGNNVE